MKKLVIATSCLVLSACSSQGFRSVLPIEAPYPKIEFENLYLKGIFNWWEARETHRFVKGNTGWYVELELIADGQPYDFKISDFNWTPDQTCGATYANQQVVANSTTYALCAEDKGNLTFTPEKTGIYRFSIFDAQEQQIGLTISKR